MTTRQTLVVACIALAVLVAGFCMGSAWSNAFREKGCEKYLERTSKDYTDVGGNIDIEYYQGRREHFQNYVEQLVNQAENDLAGGE